MVHKRRYIKALWVRTQIIVPLGRLFTHLLAVVEEDKKKTLVPKFNPSKLCLIVVVVIRNRAKNISILIMGAVDFADNGKEINESTTNMVYQTRWNVGIIMMARVEQR